MESTFFIYREDPLTEETLCAEDQAGSHKSFIPDKTGGNATIVPPSPLIAFVLTEDGKIKYTIEVLNPSV